MTRCWSHRPRDRPPVTDICQNLELVKEHWNDQEPPKSHISDLPTPSTTVLHEDIIRPDQSGTYHPPLTPCLVTFASDVVLGTKLDGRRHGCYISRLPPGNLWQEVIPDLTSGLESSSLTTPVQEPENIQRLPVEISRSLPHLPPDSPHPETSPKDESLSDSPSESQQPNPSVHEDDLPLHRHSFVAKAWGKSTFSPFHMWPRLTLNLLAAEDCKFCPFGIVTNHVFCTGCSSIAHQWCASDVSTSPTCEDDQPLRFIQPPEKENKGVDFKHLNAIKKKFAPSKRR